MILMDRICFPDVPLKVVFLRFHIEFSVQSFQRVKLLLLHNAHSKRLLLGQEPFSSPGADYPPQIIFKTAAPILAVGQRLLSYNTCRRFLILRSDNFSWLLHLPGLIVLAGSKNRRLHLMANG